MYTNRIARYETTRPVESINRSNIEQPHAAKRPVQVPPGFVVVPFQPQSQLPDLYRIAYEAAQTAAREKLLILLRSRAQWN